MRFAKSLKNLFKSKVEENDLKKESTSLVELLTQREKEVFLLLLEGYTLKKIASQLGIAYSTSNTYMTGIYKKLKVNSRAELIIKYRNGNN